MNGIIQISMNIYFMLGVVILLLYTVMLFRYAYSCLIKDNIAVYEKDLYIVALINAIYLAFFCVLIYMYTQSIAYKVILGTLALLVFTYLYTKLVMFLKKLIARLIHTCIEKINMFCLII